MNDVSGAPAQQKHASIESPRAKSRECWRFMGSSKWVICRGTIGITDYVLIWGTYNPTYNCP